MKPKTADQLYPIEVVEEDGDRVKVHYVGYGLEDDEWRKREDIEDLTSGSGDGERGCSGCLCTPSSVALRRL